MNNDVRAGLAQLIRAGLNGRSLKAIWRGIAIRLAPEGIHHETVRHWAIGEAFPSTRRRQDALADEIGGKAGAAIRILPSPAFRGFRARVMQEKDEMKRAHGRHQSRKFHWVWRRDAVGKTTKQAEIVCALCGYMYHHSRRGSQDSEEFFEHHGWEVGRRDEDDDICPKCALEREEGKKMNTHTPPPKPPLSPTLQAIVAPNGAAKNGNGHTVNDPPPERTIQPEDRRLLLKTIEEHFDESEDIKAYRLGWSDLKIAKDYGCPLAWVKEVREFNYGPGNGEDPGVAELLAGQVEIKAEFADLNRLHRELMASVRTEVGDYEKLARQHGAIATAQEAYGKRHTVLSSKVERLLELADKVQKH